MSTTFWLAMLLAALMFVYGCARMFTSSTKASYKITTKDGVITEVFYESDKEQVGLDADIDPRTGKLSVKVDKSGTLESVVAASLQLQVTMARVLEQLLAKTAATGPLK